MDARRSDGGVQKFGVMKRVVTRQREPLEIWGCGRRDDAFSTRKRRVGKGC